MPARSAALVVASACVVAVVSGGASATPAVDSQTPRSGGTIVVGLVPEPPTLNQMVPPGSSTAATGFVANPTMDTGLVYDDRVRLRPLLLEALPRIVRRNPFTIRFTYKQAARWNDGTPVTGHDFVFAWRTLPTMGAGWDQIRRVQVGGPGAKTVTVTFRTLFANWRATAGERVLPRHALEGEDFQQVWRNDISNPKTGRPISNGPFQFGSWERGKQIVLVRNRSYWRRRAYLDRLVFRVFPDAAALNRALRAGEVDLAFGGPQFLQVADFLRDRRFRIQSGPAYAWEHLDLQQGPQGHPALERRYVRQALAAGINRAQVARNAYGDIAPDVPVLQSAIFKPFEPQYRPNWAVNAFSQQRAIDLLRRNGCTGGPARPGAGGIYRCPGVGELSFRFTTTAGHAARELAFRIMQTQLRSVGIELQPRLVPPAQLGSVLFGGDWDIVMFTWVGWPGAWSDAVGQHGCGGSFNLGKHCNQAATDLLKRALETLDEDARVALLNRADALLARDVALLPLFSLPSFVIHRTAVRGVVFNPVGNVAPAGNPGDWWLAR